jgi:anti-anti-sigma regulatory factor
MRLGDQRYHNASTVSQSCPDFDTNFFTSSHSQISLIENGNDLDQDRSTTHTPTRGSAMPVATTHHYYIDRERIAIVIRFTVNALEEDNYDIVSDELLELVSWIASNAPIPVVVELSEVCRIDSLGLAMLQAFKDSIQDSGGDVFFRALHPSVLMAVHESEWDHEFKFQDSHNNAIL